MPRKSKIGGPAEQAQANRDAMARRSREQSAAVADIGEIPAIVDSERREACRLDLLKFLQTYFPASTGLKPFSDDHCRAIGRIQRCILDGGLFVNAFPRGFAKTTISENAAIWATIYGHRKFVPVFGSEASASAANIDSIKLELSQNDLLFEDFPEVCHPIRALEGKVQRSHSQTYKNVLTHIEWKADTVVLPTIPESAGGGAIITAHGITAASRGMKHKRPDGTQQRPDFIFIDDPQTDESAGSELQIDKRLDVLRKNLMKLGGHDRKMAAVINATVIKPGDMIEQLLDVRKFPVWQGERIKMVQAWSKVHDTLWMIDYAKLRNTYDAKTPGDQQRAHKEATEFYRLNRAEMDEGCIVSWIHCFDQDNEISAIQHAYNLLIDDGPEVFASECQNEPLEQEVENAAEILTADEITKRVNNLPRNIVPLSCSSVVAFIDVQKTALYWAVCAFDPDFSGAVIDYGTWPDQKRSYFSLRDIPPRLTIARVTEVPGLEGQIRAALDSLTGELMAREWKREDDQVMKIERLAPDAHWGESTDVIYEFCRRSPHAAVLVPSHGQFVGATGKPLREMAKKPGERIGLNWRIRPGQYRATRHLIFDTNFWKSFVHSRLSTPIGGRGAFTLFGADPIAHKLIADHLTAENSYKVEAKGRSVIEWKADKPSRPDNHWLDCIVGCHVLASVQGCALPETRPTAQKPVRRIRLSDLQKRRTSPQPETPAPVSVVAAPLVQTGGSIRLSDLQKQKRTGHHA